MTSHQPICWLCCMWLVPCAQRVACIAQQRRGSLLWKLKLHRMVSAGTSYDLCKAALQHFDAQTPVKYALRPSVRRCLEAGAADDQKV